MNTPILDFITEYETKQSLRLHMPGHKGQGAPADITEIAGADSLYEAAGIIAESEQNASRLFSHPTFYSTEGSSQCIRAMLYLAHLDAQKNGKKLKILAGRNAHKTFLSGVAMLDAEVEWLYGEGGSYLCCHITPVSLLNALKTHQPTAVYLTTPDYLGNTVEIAPLADLCHQYGARLLVDNAHGAYLKFTENGFPMDAGADLCCDSAHKTLPVLTGGAYLHTTPDFAPMAKQALSLFGSTSPSYLILKSLDEANRYLSDGYREKLSAFSQKTEKLKVCLLEQGYTLIGNEALKITIRTKSYGYRGEDFAALLRNANIEPEFADPDFVVLMLTPELSETELNALEQTLIGIPKKEALQDAPPVISPAKRVCSVRAALLSPWETLPISQSEGRVLAMASVGCPPAVPIAVSGERIEQSAIDAFKYYGISEISVIKRDA